MVKIIKDVVTKSPRGYAQKNFIFLVLSLTAAALNYAYYPAIAQFLSPGAFGAAQALIAIIMQVGAIFAGLNLVTIFLVHHFGQQAFKEVIETLQKCTTSIFVCISLLLLAASQYIAHFLHLDQQWYLLIVSLNLITSVPFIIAFGYLLAQKRFVSAGLLQISTVVLKLIFGALGAYQFGVGGALAGIALGQVAGMAGYWIICRIMGVMPWDHAVTSSLHPPRAQELLNLKPLALSIIAIFCINVLLALFISFDIIAARHYFDPAVSGLYTGASTLSNAIVFVCLPLISVLLPHLDKTRLANSKAYLFRTLGAILVVILSSVAVLYVLPRPLLSVFGSSYTAMSPLLWKLGILMGLVSLATLLLQVSALYAPKSTLLICVIGSLTLVAGVIWNHQSVESFVSVIMASFATIVILASLQLIRIYTYGTKTPA